VLGLPNGDFNTGPFSVYVVAMGDAGGFVSSTRGPSESLKGAVSSPTLPGLSTLVAFGCCEICKDSLAGWPANGDLASGAAEEALAALAALFRRSRFWRLRSALLIRFFLIGGGSSFLLTSIER
jgi:hypothetical protein